MTPEEIKASLILLEAARKAKELLDEAERLALVKLNGFTNDDRNMLNSIDGKVNKIGEDIKDLPQKNDR